VSQEQARAMDVEHAHRYFAAHCFNHTWTLIDKTDRSDADNEAMILCALASLWHWTQRPDRTNQSLSIGHWQAARVYALVGQGDNSMRHALHSLELAGGSPPFYVGYAHEAIARAAAALGDTLTRNTHLQQAEICAIAVTDDGERAALEQDLRQLAAGV
jgi:hypothetical protein